MAQATEMVRHDTLPAGWRMVRFDDVVRQVKDRVEPEESGLERFVAGEHMDTDGLHIRRWGVIGDGYLGPAFHRLFRKGQVLYGSRRTYLRKVALAEWDGVCANTTFVLEPKSDNLLPELLPFIMQTDAFNEHSVKQSRGSVNPYVNFSDLAWYEFPLPPKDEQRRIAELLWAADEVEQKRVELVKILNELHSTTSLELFHEAATMSDMVRCADACIDITVGIVVTPAKYYVAKGVPALRSLNVFPNRFVLDELVEISHEAHLSFSKSKVSQGDVVVVRTGRPGDSAVIPDALDNSNCIDLLIARPKPILRSWYLCHYLNSAAGRRQLSRGIAGTAQQHFNVGELKKLPIPIPPLSEQDGIIDILGTLNDRLAHVESQIRRDAQVKTQLREQLLMGRSVEHVH